ncbi:unnamed protein product [Soboliphyme baturini]|uniref:Transposase n=1 Tax=Soboliphyme baturini TaxID=241478 RepID=A0A183JAL9_9BILA|nr:unnamed protein product [Soboliphyme baturini]
MHAMHASPGSSCRIRYYRSYISSVKHLAIHLGQILLQPSYKLVTPKWKNFQSLKIGWKDRVRLNNVIWRAWHRQFVVSIVNCFCFVGEYISVRRIITSSAFPDTSGSI